MVTTSSDGSYRCDGAKGFDTPAGRSALRSVFLGLQKSGAFGALVLRIPFFGLRLQISGGIGGAKGLGIRSRGPAS